MQERLLADHARESWPHAVGVRHARHGELQAPAAGAGSPACPPPAGQPAHDCLAVHAAERAQHGGRAATGQEGADLAKGVHGVLDGHPWGRSAGWCRAGETHSCGGIAGEWCRVHASRLISRKR